MSESIRVSAQLPASPQRIYHAWMDSQEHTNITGGLAIIDPILGGRFSAWDGYIQGTTLELQPPHRIVQNWRTSDFPADSPDSLLEVLLEENDDGTQITLVHTEIPDGQSAEYEQGWIDYYFEPMRAYFVNNP